MVSFADLKKRNRANDLRKKLEADNIGFPRDERIWTPTVGDDGTGTATIRFLPEINGEETPWVRRWSHFFKGPTGRVYNELSLTTVGRGEEDPLAELNRAMWVTEDEEYRKIVRQRSRKVQYFSNIYVIRDPGNPENEGKVFIYRYGKKIFDIIKEAMTPEDDDKTPIDPFNLWGWPDGMKSSDKEKWIEENGPPGANFKLKINNQGGFRNYDRSFFEEPSTMGDFDDDQLFEIWSQCYPLQDYVDPKLFKTRDELKHALEAVLGVPYEDAFPQGTYTPVKSEPKRKKPEPPKEPVAPETEEVDEELNLGSEEFNDDDFSNIQKLLDD